MSSLRLDLTRRFLIAFVVASLMLVVSTAPAFGHVRAGAYVSCGFDSFRASHNCFIGDAPVAVFRDTAHNTRRYKVCVRGPGVRFCRRATQRGGRRSQVNILYPNEAVGWHTVKWFVRGRRGSVRTWRFYFNVGD